MISSHQQGIRLLLPIDDAVSFSLGWSDLAIDEPTDLLRQVVGLLTVDRLEYAEEWRNAAMLRICLEDRWPQLRHAGRAWAFAE
jgi:hypothetical protein